MTMVKFVPYRKKFKLTYESIGSYCEEVRNTLKNFRFERQNMIRVLVSVEEALLRMRDHFGEDKIVEGRIERRRMSNRLVIGVDLQGEPYNPLSEEETEIADLCGPLLTAAGMSPQYSYDGYCNSLRVILVLPGINPVLKIALAVLTGVLLGYAGNRLVTGELLQDVSVTVMEPFYKLWYRILNVMSGPVIFLSVITTILNSEKIVERGGRSRLIIARYFIFSFLCTGLAMAVARIVYPLAETGEVIDAQRTSGLLDLIFSIVPSDFFSPFLESNTPQLLFLAFVLGSSLTVLGSQTRNLTRVIRQANTLGLRLTEIISRQVPYVVCLLIAFEIMQHRTALLGGIWKCILLSLGISFICIAISILVTCCKKKLSPFLFLKKTTKPFIKTLRAGSLDAAYADTEKCCTKDLGMHPSFISVSLPNGLVLYMPINAIGTIFFMTFAAMKFGVTASPVWYTLAIILSVVLFVATPPVPGANLLAYIALFGQLGIHETALVDAMIFDIIFGIFANAGNQMMLQAELILQSDKMGLLNTESLLKDRISS